jgi:VanZ family protein
MSSSETGVRAPDHSSRWRLAAAVALLLQTALLYWPSQAGPQTDLPLDKVGHLLMFAGVATLASLGGIPAGWIVAVLLGQAVLSEVVQGTFLPERGGEPGDLAADVIGIGVGLAAARGYRRFRPEVIGGG